MKYVDLLTTTADTKDNTVTFTSADEVNPSAWKDVTTLASKEKHSSLLKKISTMFSNVRYLYKLLGTTDISALGTVTQALANLDGNVGDIKGIISSLSDCSAATVSGYAADALAVKELNSNLQKLAFNKIILKSYSLTSANDQYFDFTDDSDILLKYCYYISAFCFNKQYYSYAMPYINDASITYVVLENEKIHFHTNTSWAGYTLYIILAKAI